MKKSDFPFVVKQLLHSSTEEVWHAITNPSEIKKWYFEQMENFSPVVRFETKFEVHVNEKIFTHCWKVTALEPAAMYHL